jgi:hypothetical protein
MKKHILAVTPVKSIKLIPAEKGKDTNTGKLISIKKRDNNPQILLPPVAEKYIKAREHDFL